MSSWRESAADNLPAQNAKRLKHDGWALTTIIKVMRADWHQTDVEERIALLQEAYDSE